MNARVCRCCGGVIGTEAQRPGSHVCPDCERLLEDDSPARTLEAMAELERQDKDSAPAPTPAEIYRGAEAPVER